MADKPLAVFESVHVGRLNLERADGSSLLRVALTDTDGRTHFLAVTGPIDGSSMRVGSSYRVPVREHDQPEALVLTVWPDERRAELRRR